MADLYDPRMVALAPLTRRVRRDATAVKRNGRQAWTNEALTKLRMMQHLNGGAARGVCPIKPGESTTMVGLYDLDSHGGEVSWDHMAVLGASIVDVLGLVWGAAPLTFRSSGGRGIHIFVVWDDPQPARDVRLWLADVVRPLGLKSGTRGVGAGEVEIFPKQDKVEVGSYGNQFILPLSGASELLVPCDLSGALVPTAQPLTAEMWIGSPPVPAAPALVREIVSRPRSVSGLWVEALDAIPNGRGDGDGEDTSLGYDEWRNVVFAIHYETGGSAEGLEVALEFSRRSPKFDGDFLEDRVWQYIRHEPQHPVTGDTICYYARRYGWAPAAVVEAFPTAPVPETAAQDDREAAHAAIAAEAERAVALAQTLLVQARDPCTDLANAARVVRAHGGQLLAQSGAWYAWDGRRYAEDRSAAVRAVCHMSVEVHRDADEAEMTARRLLASLGSVVPDGVRLPKAKAFETAALKKTAAAEEEAIAVDTACQALTRAEKLRAWASVSEMKARIDAAMSLAEAQLQVQPEELDTDPWLFNVHNGTIDLRTGELRAHNIADRITQLAPLEYDPDADTSVWERALLDICCGDQELAAFLQRWYGYCLTGHVHEQVFLVLYGDGANGKSLLLDLMQATSGEYATSAPPGLLASPDRNAAAKDTELATLRGRRMIAAHESRAGSELREDLIKMATGSDKLSGRHLYGSPFEFSPTHKLQLLTNHRPIVRTQDHGTWRRIVLVPFAAKFVSAADLAAGRGTHLADPLLAAKMRQPDLLRSVLAWRVRGAQAWAAQGLQVPASVRLSSSEYQAEQDRAGRFVADCCERGEGYSEAMTGLALGGGLYGAYKAWAHEAGTHAISAQRLAAELQRLGFPSRREGRQVVVQGLRLVA